MAKLTIVLIVVVCCFNQKDILQVKLSQIQLSCFFSWIRRVSSTWNKLNNRHKKMRNGVQAYGRHSYRYLLRHIIQSRQFWTSNRWSVENPFYIHAKRATEVAILVALSRTQNCRILIPGTPLISLMYYWRLCTKVLLLGSSVQSKCGEIVKK